MKKHSHYVRSHLKADRAEELRQQEDYRNWKMVQRERKKSRSVAPENL